MTDYGALIAELREHAKWSDMPICGTAADALEQLTRTVAAAELRIDNLCQAHEAQLAAAEQRLRTVEAETWEQAAKMVAGDWRSDQDRQRLETIADKLRRRAQAAREDTHVTKAAK